jgi:hypothetical protein
MRELPDFEPAIRTPAGVPGHGTDAWGERFLLELPELRPPWRLPAAFRAAGDFLGRIASGEIAARTAGAIERWIRAGSGREAIRRRDEFDLVRDFLAGRPLEERGPAFDDAYARFLAEDEQARAALLVGRELLARGGSLEKVDDVPPGTLAHLRRRLGLPE